MPDERPRHYRKPGPWMTALRELHARGWSDAEIADALGDLSPSAIQRLGCTGWRRPAVERVLVPGAGGQPFTRRQVRHYRQALGLKGNPPRRYAADGDRGELIRARSRERQKEAGFFHLLPPFLRREQRWGAGHELTPALVEVLCALRDHGPMTRRRLALALGRDDAASLRDRAGTYLGRLASAGLVTRTGTGRDPRTYALAPAALPHGPRRKRPTKSEMAFGT